MAGLNARSRAGSVAVLITLLLGLPTAAASQPAVARDGEVLQAARSFRDALVRGDSLGALALLHDDAIVFE